MTVLTACQLAVQQLIGQKPAAIFSSQEPIAVEMAALVPEAATDIMKAHDWQELTEFQTITGDGTSEAFDLPDDFDRQVMATDMYDPDTWCWDYYHVTNFSTWMRYKNGGFALIAPGVWTIRKNQFHFLPVPSAGKKADFIYISNKIYRGANGTTKSTVDSDDDGFVLDERLLKLALVWRWKELKQMEYGEDLKNYDVALSQAMARDKGARVIRSRRIGVTRDWRQAYPWPLGPSS